MSKSMESRIKMLTGMNEIIMNLNNEDAIISWLMGGVPDGADDEEIAYMAQNDDTFEYCVSLFLDIMRKKSAWDDGLCINGKVITANSRKEN